jgi:hypothetical protein
VSDLYLIRCKRYSQFNLQSFCHISFYHLHLPHDKPTLGNNGLHPIFPFRESCHNSFGFSSRNQVRVKVCIFDGGHFQSCTYRQVSAELNYPTTMSLSRIRSQSKYSSSVATPLFCGTLKASSVNSMSVQTLDSLDLDCSITVR